MWVVARQSAPARPRRGPPPSWQDGGQAGHLRGRHHDREPPVRCSRRARASCRSSTSTPTRRPARSSSRRPTSSTSTTCGCSTRRRGKARQVTHLNPDMERYELGQARLIEWRSITGDPLKGALLLPPGYKAGTARAPRRLRLRRRLRLAVSQSLRLLEPRRRFNCHVLATRGYAVLAPDAPSATGCRWKTSWERSCPASTPRSTRATPTRTVSRSWDRATARTACSP